MQIIKVQATVWRVFTALVPVPRYQSTSPPAPPSAPGPAGPPSECPQSRGEKSLMSQR